MKMSLQSTPVTHRRPVAYVGPTGRIAPQYEYAQTKVSSTQEAPWTAEEDAELLRIRTVHPAWTDSQVANAMSTARTPTQVHNHWWDKVNPTLRWDAWTTQEDGALLKGRNLGLKWSEIVKTSPCLANRSNTAAKNRWHLLQRKRRAGEAAGGLA